MRPLRIALAGSVSLALSLPLVVLGGGCDGSTPSDVPQTPPGEKGAAFKACPTEPPEKSSLSPGDRKKK